MEHVALLVATLGYLFAFGHTLFALGAGRFRPGRFNVTAMTVGVTAQLWYLAQRGAREHACPLGSLAETLIFLSWAIALIYLVIGPAYRLSLMGAFTAPLVLLLQIAALLLPGEVHRSIFRPNPWVEAHAALSLVAYGAFGLACVAGAMYLVQESQLKSRRPSPLFHHLPPISNLADAIARLLWMGFLLLTLSFAAGLLSHGPVPGVKSWVSLLIWCLYAVLLAGSAVGRLRGRRLALSAAVAFLPVLLLLPVLQQLSVRH
jgi:HemX protein